MDVTVSPDGKFLASSSTDGSVKLWDYREGRLLRYFTNHLGNWARRVAFSPDSQRVTAATYDGSVSVWDTATGAVTLSLPIKGRIADVLFTPDGRSVVTASRENTAPVIQFWDALTGNPDLAINHTNSIQNISISSDGRLLASAGAEGLGNLWELPSGRWLRAVHRSEKSGATMVDLSPDGRFLAMSGQWVNTVFAVNSGATLAEMRGHQDGMMQIRFSPDGRELASASGDATVRLWDARTGKIRRIFPARLPDAPITSIAFSADGAFEAVGSVDGVVRVWDARNGSFRYQLRGHEGAVLALEFSRNNAWLFSGGADRLMRVWDMGHGTISAFHPFFDRADAMGAIACGGTKREIASASGPWGSASLDHSIKIWQSHFDRPLRALQGHTTSVQALAFASGIDRLVSAGLDGTVKLWDSRKAECLHTLTNDVLTEKLAFTPDASTVIAGMANGRVRLLDAETLATTREWIAHSRPVQSLALSADGRWLATASADYTVAVWDVATGSELRRFTNVTSHYLPVAFHPQRPVLAFAQRDEMVVHANVETGEILFQRAIFPDGEWLAWNPVKAFYIASPRGSEHARLRLAEQLTPVYPLQLYRKELSRPTNLLAALAGPAPNLAPKNFQLW